VATAAAGRLAPRQGADHCPNALLTTAAASAARRKSDRRNPARDDRVSGEVVRRSAPLDRGRQLWRAERIGNPNGPVDPQSGNTKPTDDEGSGFVRQGSSSVRCPSRQHAALPSRARVALPRTNQDRPRCSPVDSGPPLGNPQPRFAHLMSRTKTLDHLKLLKHGERVAVQVGHCTVTRRREGLGASG